MLQATIGKGTLLGSGEEGKPSVQFLPGRGFALPRE
jgi:hypothetical protein